MLTKTKNIRKKSHTKNFFQTFQRKSKRMALRKQQPKLKEIRALGSEIIATWISYSKTSMARKVQKGLPSTEIRN